MTEHITVTVPAARTISTVTGTNWEGVGVVPDLAAASEEAFETAHKDALRRAA